MLATDNMGEKVAPMCMPTNLLFIHSLVHSVHIQTDELHFNNKYFLYET